MNTLLMLVMLTQIPILDDGPPVIEDHIILTAYNDEGPPRIEDLDLRITDLEKTVSNLNTTVGELSNQVRQLSAPKADPIPKAKIKLIDSPINYTDGITYFQGNYWSADRLYYNPDINSLRSFLSQQSQPIQTYSQPVQRRFPRLKLFGRGSCSPGSSCYTG